MASWADQLATLIPDEATPVFRTQEMVRAALKSACQSSKGLATFYEIGRSEEGRPLDAIVMGRGQQTVLLLAGAHADEPVGPETLRWLVIEGLRQAERLQSLLERFRFVILPHINPDGEARNRCWTERWPSLEAYLAGVVRELPGRDLEFGYPDLRSENRAIADFLRAHAPFSLYINLHSMGFAEGALLLIERHWSFRTETLQQAFAEAARAAGLELHDHNRKGEKGFFYLGPGFMTTPEGEAMRTFFLAQGDPDTAAHFRMSSMEFTRSLGGDPLCLVTELPLFVVRHRPSPPGVPVAYLEFREQLPALRLRAQKGVSLDEARRFFGLRALPLPIAMRLQLQTIGFALETVAT
ncbi:M14 family zinc carboxypeptidase [Rhodothermus profundi]|uniref:Zinc carboxypeptidase n=1 Tax=Rhodothermus profundi TaxID=633813 RepID=A0A1M6PLY6_9BACT|nr:M14 family zinc carboxypeptidase [Rhodothermus profundi]SHK08955.1 Zinc carboxypeptidase [Rhodothermus profundi]